MKNNQIEYARCMTKLECDQFFRSLIEKSNSKINSYKAILEKNKDRLIEAYNKYALIMSENSIKVEKQFHEDYKAFVNKTCVCGSNVKYIDGFNFYGCVNYKTEGRHKNFVESENIPYKHRVEPSTSYVTNILYDLDLKKVLNAKSLFNFYTELGFMDLSLKYNQIPYSKKIDTYTNVKQVANEFEKKSIENLKLTYPTVIPQFGILYKFIGDIEKKCFLDALCSNDNEVHIYECKTNEWCIDEDQKNLYINLLQHIENKGREIRFTYLFDKTVK